MKIMVSLEGKEAEKHLLRALAEVALEVGREEACDVAGGRCTALEGTLEASQAGCRAEAKREEAEGDETSCRVLPCIDSHA